MRDRMSHPVFIVGHPRSGTSIIYRTLQKHSSFRAKRISLQETGIFASSFVGLKFLGRPNEALLNYMLDDLSLYEMLQRKVFYISLFQKYLSQIPYFSNLCKKIVLLWNASLNPIVIRNYFLVAKISKGCKRLVEKTPSHIKQIDRILSTYKEAKILVIIRHPVHVYTSFVKRAKNQPDKKWLKIDIHSFIKSYKRTHLITSENLAAHEGRVKCFLYEDFVKNPETEFKLICDFLSEDYQKDAIEGGEESLNFWKPDPFLAKPITPRTKKWSDFISHDQCHFIESKLKNEMENCGYQKES
jgi:hypothetical protein